MSKKYFVFAEYSDILDFFSTEKCAAECETKYHVGKLLGTATPDRTPPPVTYKAVK